MKALEFYDGGTVAKLALKLVVLTFVRTAELRFARWNEFEGLDSCESLCRIPPRIGVAIMPPVRAKALFSPSAAPACRTSTEPTTALVKRCKSSRIEG